MRTRENPQELPPHFSFEHLHHDFHLDKCDRDGKAALAEALVKRSSMTWAGIYSADRHGLGSENMPVKQTRLRGKIPERFSDHDKLLILRYHGNKPMAGFRVERVYYVLAVEAEFGDLYDHG
jgi:hypothetical protein